MLERVAGSAGATDTAIGALPRPEDLNVKGLNISPAALKELLRVDQSQWRQEVGEFRKYLAKFGARVPAALTQNLDSVEKALG
jgi:phosphoenolpyruvate carboxykinase (GTP)